MKAAEKSVISRVTPEPRRERERERAMIEKRSLSPISLVLCALHVRTADHPSDVSVGSVPFSFVRPRPPFFFRLRSGGLMNGLVGRAGAYAYGVALMEKRFFFGSDRRRVLLVAGLD